MRQITSLDRHRGTWDEVVLRNQLIESRLSTRQSSPRDRRLPPRRSSQPRKSRTKRICNNLEVLTYEWIKTGAGQGFEPQDDRDIAGAKGRRDREEGEVAKRPLEKIGSSLSMIFKLHGDWNCRC